MEVYLDNAASTKVDKRVLAKFNNIAETLYGNPSSEHMAGILAREEIEKAKNIIGKKINCKSEEVFFTNGATMSNNVLIQGMLRNQPETVFITSVVEHNDIIRLYDWLPYAKQLINVNKNGIIDISELSRHISKCSRLNIPCLVSIQMANSETGIIQPIKLISKIVHEYNKGYLHVDATQFIPYYPIDVQDFRIDAMSMSGQKINGLKGTGLLYIRNSIQNKITPIIFGEQGLIGGTPSTPLIASLGEAFNIIEYNSSTLENKRDSLLYFIRDIGGKVIGKIGKNRLPNNIFCRFPGIKGLDLVNLLNDVNIYIGTGSACSTDSDEPSHVALAYGLSSEEALECVRFTICEETTEQEIEYTKRMLKSIISLLK
ncbi:cysteine desulfurase [Eubacterium ruminantium]|uniref:cysteine desulfurase n=1 Tax=Eubacterium ruminantium TaxID=42322 RepID=A0A1T4Q2V9_9FIRM|nr:cysteine desulfurase family protein [Eubacterium ruminantium]SCW64494.1 cysteine desulfurase [Eubacterium ruminantium]SDN29586.1 cysteine desulfurase [Eubacterium ruminantium]SJZ98069.1 cysteine desulfurase [Eubacterium ruminantium]